MNSQFKVNNQALNDSQGRARHENYPVPTRKHNKWKLLTQILRLQKRKICIMNCQFQKRGNLPGKRCESIPVKHKKAFYLTRVLSVRRNKMCTGSPVSKADLNTKNLHQSIKRVISDVKGNGFVVYMKDECIWSVNFNSIIKKKNRLKKR